MSSYKVLIVSPFFNAPDTRYWKSVYDDTSPSANLDPEQRAKCRGLSELQKWLQVHGPADAFMHHKLPSDQCVRSTRSFLQLLEFESLFNIYFFQFLFCHPYTFFYFSFENNHFIAYLYNTTVGLSIC